LKYCTIISQAWARGKQCLREKRKERFDVLEINREGLGKKMKRINNIPRKDHATVLGGRKED